MLNLWLFRNKLWIPLFALLLVIKISSAVEFGIYPPELAFETNTQEETCKNLTFFSSYENLPLALSDKWALQKRQTKDIADYISNSSSLKISINYPKEITVQKGNIIPICIKANSEGIYQGILIFEAEQSLMMGAWIHVKASADKNEKISLENLSASLTGFVSEDSLSAPSHKWLILESFFLFVILISLALILKKRRKQAHNFT